MADTICNCPHCNQPVTIDESWAGQQLQCPSCSQIFVAPGAAAPPPPPPPSRPGAGRPGAMPQRQVASKTKEKESAGAGKFVFIGIVVVILAVGGWVLFTYGGKWQKKFSANADKEAAEGEGGGQMGHIANVYDVLDATDPDKGFMTSRERASVGKGGGDDAEPPPEKEAPVVPATWTLDADSAKIPASRVNGAISGAKFLSDSAQLDVVGNAIVLSLRQGEDVVPDREILVYLRLKPGEKLGGGSWTITKEMKGATVPQVAKRWRADPRYAPTVKSYATGYVMKLELELIRAGEVKGKIFIALPDTEQSVAAGSFTADTSLPDSPVPAAKQ